MGGATSLMSATITQAADTIDWTVRCDWLQVAKRRLNPYYNYDKTCKIKLKSYKVLQASSCNTCRFSTARN